MAEPTKLEVRDPFEGWVLARFEEQHRLLDRLRQVAEATVDPDDQCVAWLALRRQARRRLVTMETVGVGVGGRYPHLLAPYREHLERSLTDSVAVLRGFDQAALRSAARRLGLAVAVVGKGGAGKSFISGTLARLLARRGRRVLTMDLDPNPGLAYSLGVPSTDAGLPAEALEWHGSLSALNSALEPADVVDRYAVRGPDDVRYLGIAKIVEPERAAYLASRGPTFQLVLGFAERGWDVIGDMEAGPNTPFQGFHLFADRVLLVVGPSVATVLTAERLRSLIGEIPTVVVANKVAEGLDPPGLVPDVRVPFDQATAEADRLGIPAIDHCPGSPAVAAVEGIAEMLLDSEVSL